ncbi:MAG: hypothetical protein ACQEW2_06590 [Bacillota bacterium]|nr:hypothetical protein [Cytobacillus firmus]MDD9311682.1 hypothetical protein [Cytobacillus firmus]MEC1894467.1 hypothetical protein [Cytobacillus firmus]MED1942278.1 hypothetical protein [Cytobacillus firmus]MED4448553.1 hypothetical protein [Cytobacillus firmus]MED4770227.1 hypothetical protein [Cytobacillus firmus]
MKPESKQSSASILQKSGKKLLSQTGMKKPCGKQNGCNNRISMIDE